MQTTISTYSKSKITKTQSSLNNSIAEEEETHSEKDADTDIILFNEHSIQFTSVQSETNINWPRTETQCFLRASEILIPPPKI